MRKRTRARECALKILYQIDITGEPFDDVLQNFWKDIEEDADTEIKGFVNVLVSGIAENGGAIDGQIAHFARNWQIERMAMIDRNILRLATFELLFLEDIPRKVSINEAIDLAKKYGDKDSGKFVNGILDKIRLDKQ